jgi:hypothetical protein
MISMGGLTFNFGMVWLWLLLLLLLTGDCTASPDFGVGGRVGVVGDLFFVDDDTLLFEFEFEFGDFELLLGPFSMLLSMMMQFSCVCSLVDLLRSISLFCC